MIPRQRKSQIKLSQETIERAARMYKTNNQAAKALGIAASSFRRLCKNNDIVPPSEKLC